MACRLPVTGAEMKQCSCSRQLHGSHQNRAGSGIPAHCNTCRAAALPGGLLDAAADEDCTADAEAVHLAYLTPAHKRKGKGGRQPAADPRLDPSVDPKRARRILANRLSAARSKMKQKSHVEVLHAPACPPHAGRPCAAASYWAGSG